MANVSFTLILLRVTTSYWHFHIQLRVFPNSLASNTCYFGYKKKPFQDNSNDTRWQHRFPLDSVCLWLRPHVSESFFFFFKVSESFFFFSSWKDTSVYYLLHTCISYGWCSFFWSGQHTLWQTVSSRVLEGQLLFEEIQFPPPLAVYEKHKTDYITLCCAWQRQTCSIFMSLRTTRLIVKTSAFQPEINNISPDKLAKPVYGRHDTTPALQR